jgi:hypothetical protein
MLELKSSASSCKCYSLLVIWDEVASPDFRGLRIWASCSWTQDMASPAREMAGQLEREGTNGLSR